MVLRRTPYSERQKRHFRLSVAKGIDAAPTEGSGNLITSGAVNEAIQAVIGLLYPVGSVYVSVNNVNPQTYLSGTQWAQFGQGRTLVGMGSNGQTDYATVEAVGGSDSVTITAQQMPSHTHTQNSHNHTQNPHGHSNSASVTTTSNGSSSVPYALYSARGTSTQQSIEINNATPAIDYSTAVNQNTGGGQAHENRMPYITVFFWKRTA